jgi:hypothetical protein
VSNYASNFHYRAWGGLKSVTDGSNRTSSLVHNSKLQTTHFEISGNVVNQDYDYYNDGRIEFVHNTNDSNFDRSYAAAILVPNDELGGDMGFLIVDAEHATDPLKVQRYQNSIEKKQFVLTGQASFSQFMRSVKGQFK